MNEQPTEKIHIGVRTLVEFTWHGEDIRPVSMTALQEGTLGHKARQKLLPPPWQSEVPLTLLYPLDSDPAWEENDGDGSCSSPVMLEISGRMDAFLDGDIPCVEEIKLWRGKQGPDDVQGAHMAQAICYAHMLFAAGDYHQIDVRVVYVNTAGTVRGEFTRAVTPAGCAAEFDILLNAFLRRLRTVRRHIRDRNASLRSLGFPFAAFRPGQREMAEQVYLAIRRRKRLLASLPTGTGKSAATLFPALKALSEGLTNRIYYLTARTTQRQGPHDALDRMRLQPLHLWVLTLDAKDKQCPRRTVCHPDYCPRAKGHFLRDTAAISEMLESDDWTPEKIKETADRYQLCPFEFSLSLAELADVTVCDYNYALDPFVHIQRIFDKSADTTLLIDEAHHLPERLRDMLSGEVDGSRIRKLRTVVGQSAGRKHPLYQAMTKTLKALADLPVPEDQTEGRLEKFPDSLPDACADLCDAFQAAQYEMFPWDTVGERLNDTLSPLISFIHALASDREIACLWTGNAKNRHAYAYALDVGTYFDAVTAKLPGTVCFSATIDPLPEMRTMLGCNEEDGCFSAPSAFPAENMLLLRRDINLRYQYRKDAVPQVCRQIEALVSARPGHYLAFFPSFAYLRQVAQALTVPFIAQTNSMTQAERDLFLSRYTDDPSPVLGLCVLGGLFSEGIDLPGSALDGAVIVGTGLPQVNLFTETVRAWYDKHFQAGFLYAYQIPGMQKVAQAAGRVIRTETDRGAVLLLDDRFAQDSYRRLCPPHWQLQTGDTEKRLREFWNSEKSPAGD